jgi:predicted dithiol-disulfide oxidoreductase (DUF899 family)
MSLPTIASREEWLAARQELLDREKALTRLNDALNADRRRLPMVRIDKAYAFTGPTGEASLPDMFEGRRQLIIQHFMFEPSWEDGCSSCTASVDEISAGVLDHLHARETTLALVARAPFAKIDAYRARRGWTIPWYSSDGSDFNRDFHVTIDESADRSYEVPGVSCFLREGDSVFHTNSTYARGTEYLAGAYTFLDLTALGRQEDWEEPKGRADAARGAVPDFST